MVDAELLYNALTEAGVDFYAGVLGSLLKSFNGLKKSTGSACGAIAGLPGYNRTKSILLP
jgi:hypothetical protein